MVVWANARSPTVPLTAGFYGKFLVFAHAVNAHLWVLVCLGVVTVGAGFYYYLRVVAAMYWYEPNDTTPIQVSSLSKAVMALLVVSIFVFGPFSRRSRAPLRRSLPPTDGRFYGRAVRFAAGRHSGRVFPGAPRPIGVCCPPEVGGAPFQCGAPSALLAPGFLRRPGASPRTHDKFVLPPSSRILGSSNGRSIPTPSSPQRL